MIKYVNSAGEEFSFSDKRAFISENELRGYSWGVTHAPRVSGRGSMPRALSRPIAFYETQVGIRGADYRQSLQRLHDIAEHDNISLTPGRLWIGEEYLECFLATGSEIVYNAKGRYVSKNLTITATHPFWVRELAPVTFAPSGGGVVGGKKYNLKYPYRYGSGYSNETLNNSTFTAADMIITFYGPILNPSVTIAGNVYGLNTELLATERAIINQRDRTIIKIDESGVKYNLFGTRIKAYDVFKPCPKGMQSVQFSNEIFDITLVSQRSEPSWT